MNTSTKWISSIIVRITGWNFTLRFCYKSPGVCCGLTPGGEWNLTKL